MQGKKSTNFLVLASLYVVIVISALSFAVLYIQGRSDRAVEVRQEIATIHSDNEQFANLSGLVKNVDESGDKLVSYFVETDKIADFLEKIEVEMRSITGAEVDVKDINIIEGKKGASDEYTLNITANGSFEEVYHFLVLLENLPVRLVLDQGRVRELTPVEVEEGVFEERWFSAYTIRVLKSDEVEEDEA